MIKRLRVVGIYVKDQNEALRFYTEKMGFEVRTDITNGGYRWLTVAPKDQQDFEIVLMALAPGGYVTEEGIQTYRALLDSGQMSGGVLVTDDCHGDYEQLKVKGVEFIREPQEHPWGIEAVLKDNSGNWFTLTQQPRSGWNS